MAVERRLLLSRYCAALLTFLFACVVAVMPLPDPSQAETRPEQVQQALVEVASGEADEKADAIAGEDGLIAAGIPCLMRHKRMALNIDRGFRHRLAAATLATDPEIALRLLSDLAVDAPSGLPAWRVYLAIAEVALRSDERTLAMDALKETAQQDVPESCRADEAFLEATIASTPAEAAAALDRAVAADPGYWAAQEQLALLAARGTGFEPEACDRDAARVIRAAVQLGALAKTDVQFQRLARALKGEVANGRTQLLYGMILYETGRVQDARALWSSALEGLGGSSCDAVLRVAIAGMISNTQPQSEAQK